jgi:transposase
MKKNITRGKQENANLFVGLDVHKETIDIATADEGRTAEVRHYGRISGNLDALDKVIRKLQSAGRTLHVVYEAGPCGYAIHRHLTATQIECTVVAPSMTPKKSGDRVKTDRRDAISLARLHRAGELTAVYVPREDDEAMRDLSRAREDAKRAETKARQQLQALLLRHDIRYTGRTPWSAPHLRWLSNVKLPHPAQQITFQEYVTAIDEAAQRVARLTRQIEELLPAWRMAPVVEALQSMRGVALVTAVCVVAEVGDLTRFANPRQLMAYLGLVPSEHSSGERRRQGAITKAGNSHVRRMLVESAWARSASGAGDTHHPEATREGPEAGQRDRVEGSTTLVRSLSPTLRQRQNQTTDRHCHRQRTRRVHVGDRTSSHTHHGSSGQRACGMNQK